MTDCRLMVIEEEFARVLGVARRDGNTLSAVLRDAWGTGRLATMTRREPLKASGAHISIVAHVTRAEMLARSTEVEVANGLLNRYLLAAVRRSKLLPSGGNLDPQALDALATEVGARIRDVRTYGRVSRTPGAEDLWRELYRRMADDDQGDMASAATARGEAQTLRLSLIYALLDRSRVIDVDHLEAAYAVWSYCQASARWLYGNSTGDPVADRIAAALVQRSEGLDRTAIRDLFQRHESAKRIDRAVEILTERGLATTTEVPTEGRPRTVLIPNPVLLCDQSDTGDGSPLRSPTSLRSQPLEDWPELPAQARHGIAGELLELLDPHTEAAPGALLLDFLACFGSAVGPGPHAFADGAQHPARLFVLIIGETAKARKGTSRSNIARVMALAEPEWSANRVLSGLASGEGLIAAVADEQEADQ